jgi:hypothetical protein
MFDQLWQSLRDLLPDFASPYFDLHFYGSYLLWGSVAILVLAVIGYFFPALRSAAGAGILAVIAALGFYRKGEWDQYARDKNEIARLRKERRSPQGEWKWPRQQ